MSDKKNTPKEKTILDYQRQQEILFDIAMDVGSAWSMMDQTVRSQLMDELHGSRGLFDLVVEWVQEFDLEWETSEHDPERQYLDSVAMFTTMKMAELVSQVQGLVGSESIAKTKQSYLVRFDEHVRKLTLLDGFHKCLTESERKWLVTARNQIVMELAVKQVKYLVHCSGVLVGKTIHRLHHVEGFTYTKLSHVMDLSASRTSVIEKMYLRVLNAAASRAAANLPSEMPWAH